MAVGGCCTQLLWMKQQLSDFSLYYQNIPFFCDNTSAIFLTKNPVHHSRTKHIEIRHHFIRDHVQNGDVEVKYVQTDNQIADIFTKPLPEDRFVHLRSEMGMKEVAM